MKMIKNIILFIVVSIIVLLIMYLLMKLDCKGNHKPVYSYIDTDNNIGEAVGCSYKFEKYKSGGQGSPVCRLEDGTIIQVKQYKLVRYEKEDFCK